MKRMIALTTLLAVIATSPVYAKEQIEAEVVSHGENGQVSTIVGNGTAVQGSYTTDHPRFPGSDGKGHIYFLDGDQRHSKLRMFDGKSNATLVDLTKNKVTKEEGEFYTTGLEIVKGSIYFASNNKVYRYVSKDRVTELDGKIKNWMKENQYTYIYRMEQHDGKLILMLWRKNWTYGFASYDPKTRTMEEIFDATEQLGATNFFIHSKGIEISTTYGYVYYEKFFPRDSYDHVNINWGKVLDTWLDKEKRIYFVVEQDSNQYIIYRMSPGETIEKNENVLAGGFMGYTDGFSDEVRMQYPTDFTWDGSGYIFSDRDNNAIRKIWLDTPPLD
jgi:hypothetical protein